MISLKGGYHVCARANDRLASLGCAEQLAVFVASILPDYGVLYVDAEDFGEDGRPASWVVTRDTLLGVPTWTRLSEDEAGQRRRMHVDAERDYIEEVTIASIAELAGLKKDARRLAIPKLHDGGR